MAEEEEELAAWLEHALREERQVVQVLLEKQHKRLLTRLAQRAPVAPLPCVLPLPDLFDALPCVLPSPDLPGVVSVMDQTLVSPETRLHKVLLEVASPSGIQAEELPIKEERGRLESRTVESHTTAKRRLLYGAPPQKEENPPQGLLAVVKCPWFELLVNALIIANAVALAMEAQWKGLQHGWSVQYLGYETLGSEDRMSTQEAFHGVEFLFGVLFMLELLLRLLALGHKFWQGWWNWLDLSLVVLWLVDMTILNHRFPLNVPFLRIVRLSLIVRLLRLVRSLGSFDALFLMTTAMRGSAASLAWAVILIGTAQTVIALVLQLLLEPFIEDTSVPIEKRQEVFKYYGTFARATLTMFEITLGNWIVPCRVLTEHVDERFMLFSLAHKLIVGFSMVSVVKGVFIQETFKVAAQDDTIMLRQRARANRIHRKKMRDLFGVIDGNHDNRIAIDEFEEVMQNPDLQTWLAAQELQASDARSLFKLIAHGSGSLSMEELMKGVGLLKGTARSIDVAFIRQDLQEIREMVKAQRGQPA